MEGEFLVEFAVHCPRSCQRPNAQPRIAQVHRVLNGRRYAIFSTRLIAVVIRPHSSDSSVRRRRPAAVNL